MAYPNLVTKSQRCAKSCYFYEKQITCFSPKTKCCRVIRMSSPNKHTSAVYRVKDSSCNAGMLPPEGPQGKSNIVISSCCATEREKMESSWEKSLEIRSSNYSRGPNSNVGSSWPTTL